MEIPLIPIGIPGSSNWPKIAAYRLETKNPDFYKNTFSQWTQERKNNSAKIAYAIQCLKLPFELAFRPIAIVSGFATLASQISIIYFDKEGLGQFTKGTALVHLFYVARAIAIIVSEHGRYFIVADIIATIGWEAKDIYEGKSLFLQRPNLETNN